MYLCMRVVLGWLNVDVHIPQNLSTHRRTHTNDTNPKPAPMQSSSPLIPSPSPLHITESFFRNWDMDDVVWSSDEEEEDEANLDDYDTAMAKLKNEKLNGSTPDLNSPVTPLHSLVEEGKAEAADAVRRAPKPLQL